jgi:predicted nucleic-acid-binding protein
MHDDPAQSARASAFLIDELTEKDPGFVPLPVLCEVIWTLKTQYGEEGRERIALVVKGLIESSNIVVAEERSVAAALDSPGDLMDRIIHELGRAAGCSETVTFDRRFARLEGVRLLEG